MTITATAGGVSSQIEPRRPSWADMKMHYPASAMDTIALYAKIGGELTNGHTKPWLKNTCAVRMSYALLRSGFNLPRGQDRQAYKRGADRRWYWLRVADLRAEIYSRFKGFDAELEFDLLDSELRHDEAALEPLYLARKAKAIEFFKANLVSKSGIIVFKVNGWGNATGHFTLWDGTAKSLAFAPGHDDPSDARFYPWLTAIEHDSETGAPYLVQIEQVQFWELK